MPKYVHTVIIDNFMLNAKKKFSVSFCIKIHAGQVECDGLLISFSFKLFILAIGTWAVFYR